jgi:hypothetical protein
MSILARLTGTFQTVFQIGKAGPKIKNNSGTIEARNSGDSAYANIKGDQVQGATALINSAIQIKDNGSGDLSIRDSGDTAYKKIFALDPLTTDTQGLVTVNYHNTYAPSTAQTLMYVDIKSGSYATTYTSSTFIPNAAIISRCVVVVTAALDAGITIKVGTDQSSQDTRFQATSDNDPQTIDQYETTSFKTMKTTGGAGSDQKFVVTLSSLPTTGTVAVYLEYVVPTAFV